MRIRSLLLPLVPLAACGLPAELDLANPLGSPIVEGSTRPEAVSLTNAQKLAIGAIMEEQGSGYWTNICTGSLIANDIVLTAAHCVQSDSGYVAPASTLAFAVGADAASPTQMPGVREVHVHPSYEPYDGTAQYDVAVLVLESPITGADPLKLNCAAPQRSGFIGANLQVVGYGDTASEGSDNTRRFWAVEEVVAMSSYDFTVDGHGEAGVCTGDSGGPALWSMGGIVHIMGTLSWGESECGYTDHFARTDYHCPFIRSVIPEPAPTTNPTEPTDSDACDIEGVLFEGTKLTRALNFVRTMTCSECDGLFDSRMCEDAINNASVCQVGTTCTQCSDSDTRADGVTCGELAGYAYFGPAAAQALWEHVQ